MQKLHFRSLLIFGIFFAYSCKTQKRTTIIEEVCATPAPTYSSNVKSIINTKCATEGCHSEGRGDFRVFENFKRKVDNGEVKDKVVINKSMPPNGTLSKNEIQEIDCWIKNGALGN